MKLVYETFLATNLVYGELNASTESFLATKLVYGKLSGP